jgi:outer membrane protein OmpA-like peptidoglycan-associated protein
MKIPKLFLVCSALVSFVGTGLAQEVSAGEAVQTKGVIIGRSGVDLTIRTNDMREIAVVLSDDTKIGQPIGLLKIRKQEMGTAALVPGLGIEVEGVTDSNGRVTAKKIEFSKQSLQIANQIQGGLTPTNQNVQTNKEAIEANNGAIAENHAAIASNTAAIEQENKRFSELTDWDTKATVTLYYPVGSADLNEKQKAELADLAKKAGSFQGYIVQVAGYTDSAGNAVSNEKLSEDRAQNVVAYLQESGRIPLRHIETPGMMGETNPAASNESAQGRAENRRVVVKVLVNKGVTEQ